jgi:hypothetical protein
MKSVGTGLAVLGVILVLIGSAWFSIGVPRSMVFFAIVLLLGGGGLGWVGARMARDPNANSAVAWRPSSPIQPAQPQADEAAASPVVVSATVVAPGLDTAAAVPAPALEPSAVMSDTVARPEVEETQFVSRRPRATNWRLVDRSGTRHPVSARTVVGRAPSPESGEGTIVIAPVDGSVSKSHARITVGADGVSVEDLGSTNGTLVLLPDGRESECTPGLRVAVPPGATIEFGTDALILEAS